MDIYYNIISPPSRALALLMSNLGLLSVSWKSLDLLAGEQLAPEFVAINPQHCVPTLVDGDVVLWEANAIMVYLAEKYQIPEPGYPTDPVRRALMLQRMFFDVGTLHKAITECYSHQVVTGKQEKSETAVKKLEEVLKLLDGFLAKGKYVAGDTLTLADFSIAGTMSILTLVEHDLSSYEQITRWQNLCSEKMSGYGGLMAKVFGKFEEKTLNVPQ